MHDVIEWLESPDGEEWSSNFHWHPRASSFFDIRDDTLTLKWVALIEWKYDSGANVGTFIPEEQAVTACT